jgi:hypothetical protein
MLAKQMKFCKNNYMLSLMRENNVRIPLDFYVQTVLWAVKISDLVFMRQLKDVYRRLYCFCWIYEKRKITEEVYKLPHNSKYHWLLNDFDGEILPEGYDTPTLIRECLRRSAVTTAINLYIDFFAELGKDDRYDLGFILAKTRLVRNSDCDQNLYFKKAHSSLCACKNEARVVQSSMRKYSRDFYTDYRPNYS